MFGEILAVHWLGSSSDHVLDGRSVHRVLCSALGPADLHLERRGEPEGHAAEAGFVLDRWTGVRRG